MSSLNPGCQSWFAMEYWAILFAGMVLSGPVPAAAQIEPSVPDSLGVYLTRQMEERRIPGLAVAIARAGVILDARGLGLASIQSDAPVNPRTTFSLASVTKQFTAAGIMLLVEEGRIDLDASIGRYLADLPEEWQLITTRHLLTHTSGLPGLRSGFTGFDVTPLTISTEAQLEAALVDSLDFRPGERFQYSDVGYFILGVLTEQVSGVPWREFIESRIFTPLDMVDSYVLDQWKVRRNEARGYGLRDGELVNNRRVYHVVTPSYQGIFSNVLDLARWDAALYSDALLDSESLDQMWQPVRLNDGSLHPYGFGWQVWRQGTHRIQRHTGFTGTEIVRLPDDSLTIVVLTNLGADYDRVNSWGIALDIAAMIVPDLRDPGLRPDVAALERYIGDYSAQDGQRARIDLVEGHIYLVPVSTDRPVPLRYFGGNTFGVANSRRVVFTVDDEDVVTGFVIDDLGANTVRFVRAGG